ncbi:hypothetical protein ZWY2020_015103 [Hordeum vulgare]|nr:hypothetical protein ZWY2020_015103 [Hordeum vulgare]
MVGFFRSGNLASRVFDRQFLSPRPAQPLLVYKFTDDGKYLVAFSRNHQDLIVYRPIWLTFSCHEECDSHDLPANAERFDSFFKQLYSISLASSNEYICKDFFLYMECHQYGLFATSTAQSNDSSVTEVQFMVLEDGAILGESFLLDFINLAHSIGAYLYEDLVCIVSLRYQTIHVLQIRDSGSLVEVRRIGAFCREDDELFLYSHGQAEQGSSFLPGIKQQLLSFIFHKTWNEEPDQALRVQHLKKKFYFHFQDYVDLIIWKVTRSTDQNLAFFAELYSLFEHYYDHFHANPQNSLHEKFISSHSIFVKKMMASLPYTCQSQSPSPYFDLSIFRYDEKVCTSCIDMYVTPHTYTLTHAHTTKHTHTYIIYCFFAADVANVAAFKLFPSAIYHQLQQNYQLTTSIN